MAIALCAKGGGGFLFRDAILGGVTGCVVKCDEGEGVNYGLKYVTSFADVSLYLPRVYKSNNNSEQRVGQGRKATRDAL